jgi:molybdopterin-containing oxidoreductase family iron-sulfur binding subunit
VVVTGPRLGAREHALALAINEALGNLGRTVWFTPSPLLGAGDPRHSLASLAEALRAGDVDTLVCVGGNPSYATAGALEMSALIRRVRQSVYVGLYENETARDCGWTVPAAHFLERWGDARAYDGTLSVVQPLIEPLYGGKTTSEVLSALLGDSNVRPYELLRDSWQRRGAVGAGADFASPNMVGAAASASGLVLRAPKAGWAWYLFGQLRQQLPQVPQPVRAIPAQTRPIMARTGFLPIGFPFPEKKCRVSPRPTPARGATWAFPPRRSSRYQLRRAR